MCFVSFFHFCTLSLCGNFYGFSFVCSVDLAESDNNVSDDSEDVVDDEDEQAIRYERDVNFQTSSLNTFWFHHINKRMTTNFMDRTPVTIVNTSIRIICANK